MSYDLFVGLSGNPRSDVKIKTPTQLKLLTGIAARGSKEEAVRRYIGLIHVSKSSTQTDYNRYIQEQEVFINGLYTPVVPDLTMLPLGSWFLQFTFTLAKPWMSKDDDLFYVADSVNPVRKDKVFKVPMMSAASWKGLLRWTAMHIRLAQREELSPEDFAQERFVQTLLFGDEKGEEPGQTRDFAGFLDGLLPDEKAKEARAEYERLLRQHYILKENEPLPHHGGRLMFYPTFFDLIDVEVINPHKRETKAGTHPIYLECVPEKARGTFTLLYVPFDLIGQDEAKTRCQAVNDLRLVAEAINAMMLTYGFSAKRSSGYGVAKDEILRGKIKTRMDEKPLKHISRIGEEVRDVAW